MSQPVMEPEAKEATTVPQPPSRKKTLLVSGGGAALALLLVFGVRYLVWSAHHEETDDAYLTGHLHPISARVTDTVQQVLIDDNQHVVEGQTLVILDPNDYKVRLDPGKGCPGCGRPRGGYCTGCDPLHIAVRNGADHRSGGHHWRGQGFDPGVKGRRHRCGGGRSACAGPAR
jgi:hypothetical protein